MPSRRTSLTAAGPIAAAGSEPVEAAFAEVVGLIEQARQRAYQAVNTELVGLYWEIGRYISAKLEAAVWGEGVVDRLADHLGHTLPGQRVFTQRKLFRMRQFYEAYRGDQKVTPLVTQLPWTHNLIILSPNGPKNESVGAENAPAENRCSAKGESRSVVFSTLSSLSRIYMASAALQPD